VAFTGSERNTPMLLPSSAPSGEAQERRIKPPSAGIGALIFAITLGAFWIGAAAMYAVGYFGSSGVLALPVHQIALLAAAVLLPPVLIVASAWSFTRGQAMAAAADALADATDKLFSADETGARTAARLGRAVRRELDALNTGLDGAFTRLRALESVLETQLAALDEASARADVRAENVAARLGSERERIDIVAASLSESATRASELVAGRTAQLKTMIESAEGTLKTAGQLLETQGASFRAAAQLAAEAPQIAAVELDKQAKRIEQVSDAAMARAEFLLGRHEKHRSAMSELLQRLKDEASHLESTLTHQRSALEQSIGALSGQAKVFETMASETERQLESIMTSGSSRATQLAASFGREAERVKEISENSIGLLSKLVTSLHDAGASAQALVGETTAEAKSGAKALVGEAMIECQKLMRTATELAALTNAMKETMANAASDVEQHLLSMPDIAKQEATRVRDLVRSESEQILDLSARTLAIIHARNAGRGAPQPPPQTAPAPEPEAEGLLSMARRLTQRPRKRETGDPKSWEMSTLLSAVDSDGRPKELRPAAAAALGALEAALADLAIDLDALNVGGAPTDEDWRRYLAGDRTVFARRIADTIDEDTIARIATLNRENTRFREAANTYLMEFESMLERARKSDNGGLLASTLLSADTGKIYLAVAYALGRLSA
jgi:hypothetical protein